MKYGVVIIWSEEDKCFLAKSPFYPGIISHGDTYEEALSMLKEALKEVFAILNEDIFNEAML